jgi:hypothetical protein
MFVYAIAIAFVASVCGLVAYAAAPGLHVSPFGAALFVSAIAVVVLVVFATRWWMRVSRAAGVQSSFASKRFAMAYGGVRQDRQPVRRSRRLDAPRRPGGLRRSAPATRA